MPSMKEFVRKVCKRQIKNIAACDSDNVKRYKITLLNWLRHRNYKCNSNDIHGDIKPFTNRKFDEFPYRIDRHYKIPQIPASSSSSASSSSLDDGADYDECDEQSNHSSLQ